MIRTVIKYIVALPLVVSLFSCERKVEYTTMEITDPARHYYPILQGQELSIMVTFTNTGEVPLTIKDIQASCGCITTTDSGDILIPPGKDYAIVLSYDSTKNVGKVEHKVRFFGNIAPTGMAEMKFDVHFVPDASYHHDYEELYAERNPLKTIVDGLITENGMGYFVD